MSKFEQRDNSGVLFKNDRKESPNHPDYKGNGIVEGQEVWIDAWIKEGQKGKFMSLSIKPKEAQQAKPKPRDKAEGWKSRQQDDEAPF